MIAVGTLGGPFIGTIQDRGFNLAVQQQAADVHSIVTQTKPGLFSEYESVDKTKYVKLTETQRVQLDDLERPVKQHALAQIAVLPAIMFVCYLGLILYFKSRGGYEAQVLVGHAAQDEKFTGGTLGSGEG
jgi:hypothetical protein